MEDFMKELYFISCFIRVHLYNLFIENFMKELKVNYFEI